ncbi:class I SAM-dependent methyltransferase [Micromonosporaceae bacterium B7E4]
MTGVRAAVLTPDRQDEVVSWIHRTLRDDRALSPRPSAALRQAYAEGRVCLVERDGVPVGWILRIPHTAQVQEVAGAYVLPEHRGAGAAAALLGATLPATPVTFCTTGSERLARYLTREWDFRPCGPLDLLRLTRGRIVGDRLHPARLRYGAAYLRRSRPRLLCRDTRFAAPPARICDCPDGYRVFLTTDLAFGTGTLARYARCRGCGHIARIGTPAGQVGFAEPQLPFVERVMEHPAVGRLVHRPRLRWLTRHMSFDAATRVLDIGCGTGSFLAVLRDRYGTVGVGVEVDPALAAAGRARGREVTTGDLLATLAAPVHHLVAMFQVLEHLDDPAAALRQAYAMVAPGGLLCVEVPVTDGLARRLFGPWWFPLLPPHHHTVYSRRSLRAAVAGLPGSRIVAESSVYLPGEYLASALLPVTPLLPHPLRPHRPRPVAVPGGLALALAAAVAALPFEAASALAHHAVPLAGHRRILLRKEEA